MAAAHVVKEIALVTGANSGIGFEIAHQLLAKGTYHVLLASRTTSKGNAALEDLQSRKLPGSIELIHLDVQSDEHISAAVTSVTQKHGKLDLLVNNAAVAIPDGMTERERLQAAFNVNATGPYLLTKALIPLLRQSDNPRIVNISSGAGSIGRRLFPESPMYKIQAPEYRASKTAFNMITACLYVEHGLGVEQVDGDKSGELKGQKMKVFCYDPGFTVSNLGPHNKKEYGARDAKDTVLSIMAVIDGKRDDEAGKFIHNSGEYPW
ncbi:NAD(P)-binding protein [Plenodomus tracheiphilus IPT5]|uniref:NAD(P)-binding protein n=1 Tax=Plenodomus tracheiphilus IPT5 TaxID=1408161 RepID=A0A6A7AQM3_9PLEO|nr:NAD(P)-binding protein [Plenodomus tracheiphilus IPT5]